VANLIILFSKMMKMSLMTTILGCSFHFLKNKFSKLVNFITKSTVTTYPRTFFSFCLVSFGLEWEFAINERAFMAFKKVLSNQILYTLNEWAQYIPPRSARAMDWYEVPSCLPKSKCIREIFQVLCDMYSTLPNPWGTYHTSSVFHD
jgi:hypothetical protein